MLRDVRLYQTLSLLASSIGHTTLTIIVQNIPRVTRSQSLLLFLPITQHVQHTHKERRRSTPFLQQKTTALCKGQLLCIHFTGQELCIASQISNPTFPDS